MKIHSLIMLDNDVYMVFEIIQGRLWFEMDEPEDKDMTIDVYEVPSDTCINGKKTTYHQECLGVKHMLLPGTYIFTFNTHKKKQLTVVFKDNKLSFEVN
jgi:hypothetical protein